MTDRITLVSPNGGTEIEVFASEKERFIKHGFTVKKARPSAEGSKKTSSKGVSENGDIQG